MLLRKEVEQAKARLLSGRISLRKLSRELNVDREYLKNAILEICFPEERKLLEDYLAANKASSTTKLDDNLKALVIKI